MVHTLRLDNYTPTPRKLVLGTNSSFGTESIKIERGAGWDGLNLTATWHIPGREEPLRVALLDGDAMDVPPEVTKKAKDGVLVLAGLASGVQRASCNVEYLILEQAGVYGGQDAEPTPELAEQVLQAVQDARDAAKAADQSATGAKDIAQSVRTDADNGKFNGKDGAKGDNGDDGTTPQLKIGEDNLWQVSYDNGATWVSLGVKATGEAGEDGADGLTPHIGENGNWWIGDTDTGVSAKGDKGDTGPQGQQGDPGPDNLVIITATASATVQGEYIPDTTYSKALADIQANKAVMIKLENVPGRYYIPYSSSNSEILASAGTVSGSKQSIELYLIKWTAQTNTITLTGTKEGCIADGGTAGQVLVKKSNESFDTEWTSKAIILSTPLTNTQDELINFVLTGPLYIKYNNQLFFMNQIIGNTIYGLNSIYTDDFSHSIVRCVIKNSVFKILLQMYHDVPNGGEAGQILAKKSNTNGDTEWIDPPEEIPEDYPQIREDVSQLKEEIGDIATVGENLFNPKGTRHLNSRIDNNGNIAAGDNIVYELLVDGGTYVSNMPTDGVNKIACISKDGTATIVTPSTTSDHEEHFTVPDGTSKVYMSFWSGRDSKVESADYTIFKKGMIVAGNTLPSEYIPYYKNLNNGIKVNESNIKDGTKLNKYIDTEALSDEVSNTLFNEALNLIDSGAYLRGTLSTSGVVVESSDSTANYIYTIKIPDATFIGMNAVPQVICFYDGNMGFLESKQFADTSDDTISVNIPDKGNYAKLSYWYGRGVDGSFENVTHLKNISVTVDSVPVQKIDKQTILSQDKKISASNLCDGFELNSRLAKGIKWYILGDSRSVDLTYTTKFYHDYLCEKHKFVRKKNLAVSGARIRSADTAYHSLLEQYPNVEDDADLITIYAGINDYGQDNPTEIGTEGSTDLTTFYGAFESLITNLITNHPTAKIVVITPIPQYNFEINNTIVWGDRNDTNALGKSLDDYCNAIKKICRKYGVFVKDACYESGITPRIASQRSEYFKDGLHHNEKGQLVLANYLSDIFDLLDC